MRFLKVISFVSEPCCVQFAHCDVLLHFAHAVPPKLGAESVLGSRAGHAVVNGGEWIYREQGSANVSLTLNICAIIGQAVPFLAVGKSSSSKLGRGRSGPGNRPRNVLSNNILAGCQGVAESIVVCASTKVICLGDSADDSENNDDKE